MNGQVGDDRGGYSDKDTLWNGYETGSRCNSHQADYSTYAKSDNGWLFPSQYVEEHPGEACCCGGGIGGGEGRKGEGISCQGRAGIEPKPSKPQQAGADQYIRY